METFTIAAAQSVSLKGDFLRNLDEHMMFIKTAAQNKADIIVFPELSLTGCEPELADEMALSENDKALSPLAKSANELDITIIAGCPVKSTHAKPYLGAFIFQPGRPVTLYRKRYLHTGEELYFIPSKDNLVFDCKGKQVGAAICADIDNPGHPADAKKKGAEVYAAGVCITPNGIDETFKIMSLHSIRHNMVTVMANHADNTGGYITAGRSAAWDNSGKLLAKAGAAGRYLIFASEMENGWIGKTLKI